MPPADRRQPPQSHYQSPNMKFFKVTFLRASGMHTFTTQENHIKGHICQHNFSPHP